MPHYQVQILHGRSWKFDYSTKKFLKQMTSLSHVLQRIFMLWAQKFLFAQPNSCNLFQCGVSFNLNTNLTLTANSTGIVTIFWALPLNMQINWIIRTFVIWAKSTHYLFAQLNSFWPSQCDSIDSISIGITWKLVGQYLKGPDAIFSVFNIDTDASEIIMNDWIIHDLDTGNSFAWQNSSIFSVRCWHKYLRLDKS